MALDFGNTFNQLAQQADPTGYGNYQTQQQQYATTQQQQQAAGMPQDVRDYFKGYDPTWWAKGTDPNSLGAWRTGGDRYTDANGYMWMPQMEGGYNGAETGAMPTLTGFRRGQEPGQVGQSKATDWFYSPEGKYTHSYYDEPGWLNPVTGILAVAGLGMAGAAGALGGGAAAGGGAGAANAATTFGVVDEAAGALSAAGYGGGGAGTAAMGAGAGGYAGPTTFGVVDEAAGALSASGLGGSAAPMTTFGVVDEGAGALSAAGLESSAAPMTSFGAVDEAAGALSAAGGGSSVGGSAGGGKMGDFSWQDLVGPAMQLYNGKQGAQAAENASAAQLQAAREAMALSAPWREKGVAGLNKLSVLLGLEGNGDPEFGALTKGFQFTQDDPSYQFRLNQGLKALQNSYAGKGKLLSGAAMKGINDYAQGAASQEFGQAFNRDLATRTNLYNRLAGIAGTGQTASNTMGEYGTQAGNAQAAGDIGKASAWSDALGGAYSTYTGNELMNRILRSRGA